MTSKEEQKKLITEIMEEDAKDGLYENRTSKEEILKKALIDAYNAGYVDAQVNHVNDAENYVNDLYYASKVMTMMYDGEIMSGPRSSSYDINKRKDL